MFVIFAAVRHQPNATARNFYVRPPFVTVLHFVLARAVP
jgi:hypothetical protein